MILWQYASQFIVHSHRASAQSFAREAWVVIKTISKLSLCDWAGSRIECREPVRLSTVIVTCLALDISELHEIADLLIGTTQNYDFPLSSLESVHCTALDFSTTESIDQHRSLSLVEGNGSDVCFLELEPFVT
ncbi:unnamed protein product [Caenorhabditis brenneri]